MPVDRVSEELHSVDIPLVSLMSSLKTGVEAPKVIHLLMISFLVLNK